MRIRSEHIGAARSLVDNLNRIESLRPQEMRNEGSTEVPVWKLIEEESDIYRNDEKVIGVTQQGHVHSFAGYPWVPMKTKIVDVKPGDLVEVFHQEGYREDSPLAYNFLFR